MSHSVLSPRRQWLGELPPSYVTSTLPVCLCYNVKQINVNLMRIGPCIILILNKGGPTLMTLALLCQFTAQHVSDVNTSIFRSFRLLGALLCRLYCADLRRVGVV